MVSDVNVIYYSSMGRQIDSFISKAARDAGVVARAGVAKAGRAGGGRMRGTSKEDSISSVNLVENRRGKNGNC